MALSPFTKGNYNAKPAYDHFGFDLMLQPQDLGYPASISKNLWHISSEEMMYYTKLFCQKQHPVIGKCTTANVCLCAHDERARAL